MDTDKKRLCPKCQGEMIAGENADIGHMYMNLGQKWKKKVGFLDWPAKPMKVLTYACTKCGYLESYLQDLPK